MTNIRISYFKILVFVVLITLFSPEIITRTSIRADTLLIYFLVPLLVLTANKSFLNRNNEALVAVLTILPLGYFLSAFGQAFITNSLNLNEFSYFFGILRIYLFFLLAIIAIKTKDQANTIIKIFAVALLFHSITTIIVYFQIEPLRSLIKFYFNTESVVNKLRSMGSFSSIHQNAYFLMFGIMSLVTIFPYIKNKIFKYTTLVIALFALILPFSKAAYMGIIVFFLIYFILKFGLLRSIIKCSKYLILFLPLLFVLPERILDRLGQFTTLILFVLEGEYSGEVTSENVSVLNRFESGERAINVWEQSPLFGLGKSSLEYGFIGDSFYMSTLAQIGVLGLLSYLVVIAYIIRKFYINKRFSEIANGAIAMLIVVLLVNFATPAFSGRLMEFLPVLIIALYKLSNEEIPKTYALYSSSEKKYI